MSYFKAKISKIRFRLGLRPIPAGKLTALPGRLARFKRSTSKEREGRTDGREESEERVGRKRRG